MICLNRSFVVIEMNSQQSVDQKNQDSDSDSRSKDNQSCTRLEKRLKGEIKILKNKCECKIFQYFQDPDNKLIFYFLFQGWKGTDFEGGYYIAKFVLAENYPEKFGKAYILTPNNKLVTDRSLSFSNEWSPFYNLKNMIESLIIAFHDNEFGGISRIKSTREEIHMKAKDSIRYNAENYPEIWKKLYQDVNQ